MSLLSPGKRKTNEGNLSQFFLNWKTHVLILTSLIEPHLQVTVENNKRANAGFNFKISNILKRSKRQNKDKCNSNDKMPTLTELKSKSTFFVFKIYRRTSY